MWGEGQIFGYISTPVLGLQTGNLYNVVVSLFVALSFLYAAWTIYDRVRETTYVLFLSSVGCYWFLMAFCNFFSWLNILSLFSWLVYPLKILSVFSLTILACYFGQGVFRKKARWALLFTVYYLLTGISYLVLTFVLDGTQHTISYWGVQWQIGTQSFLVYQVFLLLPLAIMALYLVAKGVLYAIFLKTEKSNFTLCLGTLMFVLLEYVQAEAVTVTWSRLFLRLVYVIIAFGGYLFFVGRKVEKRFVSREEEVTLPRFRRQPFFVKLFLLFVFLGVLPIMLSSFLLFLSFKEIINLYIYKPLLWNLKASKEAFLQALTNVQLQTLFSTLMLVLLVGIVSVIVASAISESLRRVAEGMKKVSQGDFSFKILPTSNDEIGDVINYFNTMSEEVKKARDLMTEWNRQLETKVKERTEDLRILYDVAKAVGSSLDLELLVRRAIERLLPVLQAEAYALLFFDEQGGFEVRLAFNCQPEDFKGKEAPVGWTAVPLQTKGQTRGVLMLKIATLDERKSNLLATISEQLGVALENVLVYEKEKEAVARLTELDRLKNEFISMVSHELRTPVTSADGYVSLFLTGVLGSLTEDQKNYLKIVRENNQRLLALINRLLDFSQIESGRFSIKRELISMHEVIAAAVAQMKPQLEKKQAELNLKLEARHDNFMGDFEKMIEVFNNLIENALKFSKEEEKPKIEIVTRDAEDFLEVSVADNGIGIEKEYFDKIFNKFFQIEDTMTRKVGGVGLGLAVVKEIVGYHQGRIWVESEGKGKGSRFVFLIPVAEKA